MQFASFALVCVVAVQVVFVSAHPAAGSDKTIEQLHEEYNVVGTQLQTDLKTARAREDFKGDANVQAVLNSVEEIDNKAGQLVKNYVHPQYTLGDNEIQKLSNDIKTLKGKLASELRLLKPEQGQDQLIKQIGKHLSTRSTLLTKIAFKKVPNFG